MSKVQLQNLDSENIYPITNAEYVQGFEDKFTELNKDDVELNNKQQKDIEELKNNKADKIWVTEELTKLMTGGEIDLSDYVKKDEIKDMATITLVNKTKMEMVNGADADYSTFGDIQYQLTKKLDKSSLDNYPTRDEVTKQIIDITTEGKIDLTGYATETWVSEQNYLKSEQMIPIELDEYNRLDEEGKLDREAWYYIIDKNDEYFTKFNEVLEKIEELEEFVNQFPESDNRVYGIINRYPKYLNIPEIDSDPRDN